MATPLHVKVELELTPRWWRQLTRRLTQGTAFKPVRELHAQASEIAFKLGPGVRMLKTRRSSFIACLLVPSDTSLVALCEKAGQVVEELNKLDVGCLGDEARAKYLSRAPS